MSADADYLEERVLATSYWPTTTEILALALSTSTLIYLSCKVQLAHVPCLMNNATCYEYESRLSDPGICLGNLTAMAASACGFVKCP